MRLSLLDCMKDRDRLLTLLGEYHECIGDAWESEVEVKVDEAIKELTNKQYPLH